MAQVNPPSLTPLPWVSAIPPSDPPSGRLELRVSPVQLETFNKISYFQVNLKLYFKLLFLTNELYLYDCIQPFHEKKM